MSVCVTDFDAEKHQPEYGQIGIIYAETDVHSHANFMRVMPDTGQGTVGNCRRIRDILISNITVGVVPAVEARTARMPQWERKKRKHLKDNVADAIITSAYVSGIVDVLVASKSRMTEVEPNAAEHKFALHQVVGVTEQNENGKVVLRAVPITHHSFHDCNAILGTCVVPTKGYPRTVRVCIDNSYNASDYVKCFLTSRGDKEAQNNARIGVAGGRHPRAPALPR